MQVIYTKNARQDLINLDNKTAQLIVKKVLFFSQQSNPLQFAKKLTNFSLGQYRFRVGDYRVIFDVDSTGNLVLLIILRIKHRKDIYNI